MKIPSFVKLTKIYDPVFTQYEVRDRRTGKLYGMVFNETRGGRWGITLMAQLRPDPTATYSTRHEAVRALLREFV